MFDENFGWYVAAGFLYFACVRWFIVASPKQSRTAFVICSLVAIALLASPIKDQSMRWRVENIAWLSTASERDTVITIKSIEESIARVKAAYSNPGYEDLKPTK